MSRVCWSLHRRDGELCSDWRRCRTSVDENVVEQLHGVDLLCQVEEVEHWTGRDNPVFQGLNRAGGKQNGEDIKLGGYLLQRGSEYRTI